MFFVWPSLTKKYGWASWRDKLGSVAFGRWDDGGTEANETTLEDFGDESAAVEKYFLKAVTLPRELAGTQARVAVLQPVELCIADLKYFADEPHQLDTLDDDVAPGVDVFEPTSRKEDPVHERDLSTTDLPLVEAPFASTVSISFKTSTGDDVDLIHQPHGSASRRRNTNCHDDSIRHEPPPSYFFCLHTILHFCLSPVKNI